MAKKTDKDKLFERMGLVNPDNTKLITENLNLEEEGEKGQNDSPKRWNDVSVWINKATEEDMINAGFEFDPKGDADLFYNGEKVGFLSNFNGVMLDDAYVDELIPIFQNFRGTGVWNYDNWRKDADERKRHFGESQGLEEDDEWIQKAVDPAHKGYCTPMTKDTCTPPRRALALRFKKGIEDESVNETDAFLETVRQKIGEYANENYPWGAKDDPAAPWNEPEYSDDDEGPDPDERHDTDHGEPQIIDDEQEMPGGEKFRAEVTGKGENRWSGNAMEYDTEEEAQEWLNNLANRWFGFDMSRVVPVSMPTGQPVDMENDIIYQNFRG